MKLSQAIALPFQKFCELPPVRRLTRRSMASAAESPYRSTDVSEMKFWIRMHRASIRQLGFGSGTRVSASGERAAVHFLKDHLPASPVIFDIGANQGDYSHLLAATIPQASIYSFEPSQQTYEMLCSKVSRFSNVKTFHFGLSSETKQAQFYSNDEKGSGLASLYERNLEHRQIEMAPTETVSLRSVDEFCREQQITNIDFMKIDVEGHEIEVLKGAAESIKNDRIGSIQFEFGGCNIDSRTYFQDFYYLLSPQYYIYRIISGGLLHVPEYDEADEVFVTTNYLMLHKKRFHEALAKPVIALAG